MTGDSLGGFLSHPERKFALFDTQFWKEEPFALPCFVAAFISAVACIYGISIKEVRVPLSEN